jgi:hypothetical protein
MRLHAALAALVLAPVIAVAQPADDFPPRAAPLPANWSLGAGLSLSLTGPEFVSTGAGYILRNVPIVTASLERRLSDGTWLVVGASGTVTRGRVEVPPGESTIGSKNDYRRLDVTAGVRWALTAAGAPVEVSAVTLAEAGAVDADVADTYAEDTFPVVPTYVETSWHAGASAGIAVDRELTGGISVRIASPLLEARYSRSRVQIVGRRVDARDVSVRALVAPRVELRLAF